MKFGYFLYRKPFGNTMSRKLNIGDPIQSIAAVNLLREAGIPEEDIIPIERYNISAYDGEDVILIANGIKPCHEAFYKTELLPIPPKIHPIFISFSLPYGKQNEELARKLSAYAPIGARDFNTCQILKENNVNAYYSGCLTLTLPRRVDDPERQNKVFIIDAPSGITVNPQIGGVKYGSQLFPVSTVNGQKFMTNELTKEYHQVAQKRLDELCDDAKLVITGRVHVAAPCLAMGIPVILARNFFDFRFSFLDKYLPFHKGLTVVDSIPEAPDISEDKQKIKDVFFAALRQKQAELGVRDVFTTDKPQVDNHTPLEFDCAALPIPRDQSFNYVLWGAKSMWSFVMFETMQYAYKNSKLIGVIDNFETANEFGVKTITPGEIKNLPPKTIIFVMAQKAQPMAKELLEKLDFPYFILKIEENGSDFECCKF